MIIFKRKHLSIKWGIFAGILVFLAILLLLMFLLQTVYLDDIYKAAKKNTLNNANDKDEAKKYFSKSLMSISSEYNRSNSIKGTFN